jgi:cyclopropane-fatty-acyl-phospholipid synthase
MSNNDVIHSARTASRTPGNLALRHFVDRGLVRLLSTVSRETSGRLLVALPSAREVLVGGGDHEVAARLAFRNYRPIWKTVRRGALGFAESYISGDIDTDDLVGLFNFYMDNAPKSTSGEFILSSGWQDIIFHHRRANTRRGSQRNIAAHYDLGNEFYRAWLDPGLVYSSALFATAETSLEEAQNGKIQLVLEALDLQSEHALLEIGCGWGGFMEAAAHRVARAIGITISSEQFHEAQARLARAGLTDRAAILLQDYRDSVGTFDRLASIEMIEAVGEGNWPTYFRCISDRLKPGGKAVIQSITIRDDLFQSYRRNPDFIQRYIFPGGMLPTVNKMRHHATEAGLNFEPVLTFGASYALTLIEWRKRFHEAWPRIAALGFDERFRRMWDYYLVYCQVGFERGTIDVGLYRMVKAD